MRVKELLYTSTAIKHVTRATQDKIKIVFGQIKVSEKKEIIYLLKNALNRYSDLTNNINSLSTLSRDQFYRYTIEGTDKYINEKYKIYKN